MHRQHRRQAHHEAPGRSDEVAPQAESAQWGNAALAEEIGASEVPVGARHTTPDHIDLGSDHEVQIGPHTLTTGQVNALADYVSDPSELASMSPAQLARALELMAHEPLSPAEFAELSELFPEYDDLSLDNGNHFGASDPALIEPSGNSGPTHISEITRCLTGALGTAVQGGRTQDPALLNDALVEAAFGGHFVADAFSSGHLFHKGDVQAAVIDEVLSHPVQSEAMLRACSSRIVAEGAEALAGWRYEVTDEAGFGLVTPVTRAHIHALLVGTVLKDRPLFANGVVLAVHDALSARGVEVTDGLSVWTMFGDHHLEEVSQLHCEALIEHTYELVQSAFDQPDGFDVAGAVQGVLQRLPRPTEAGAERVHDALEEATTIEGGGMEDAVVAGSVAMIDTILQMAGEKVPGRFVRVEGGERAPGGPAEEGPGEGGGGERAQEPELHVVQPGEWLSTIADEHYGDPMRYDVLFDANTDRIDGFDDPDLIQPGWSLVVPELDSDTPTTGVS